MRSLQEGGVYFKNQFKNNKKILENETDVSIQNNKIFFKPCGVKLETKDVKYDLSSLSSNKRRFSE